MVTKFNKYDKVNESLPRQSTVDQLHRIRAEIKKSQVVKVGPGETTMGGDIGDRVMADLKKHQMNNLFWWDNPTDRHIDSYETFVKDDSRDSLGYTSKGDPKTHKGTDYVKEAIKHVDVDPWGEEDWNEGDDDTTKKIKSLLVQFIDSKGGKYKDRIITRFFPILTKEQGDGNERPFEIRGDFGDHILDNGSRKGVVLARSKSEARAIFVLSRKRGDYIDVLLTGFYRTNAMTPDVIDRELESARKTLRIAQNNVNGLENPKGINNI